jgi:hypothetical protein
VSDLGGGGWKMKSGREARCVCNLHEIGQRKYCKSVPDDMSFGGFCNGVLELAVLNAYIFCVECCKQNNTKPVSRMKFR